VEDRAVIVIALLAPAVILGSVALIRGYSIKVWRDNRDDPDRRV
jgi:hypothetical protein